MHRTSCLGLFVYLINLKSIFKLYWFFSPVLTTVPKVFIDFNLCQLTILRFH